MYHWWWWVIIRKQSDRHEQTQDTMWRQHWACTTHTKITQCIYWTYLGPSKRAVKISTTMQENKCFHFSCWVVSEEQRENTEQKQGHTRENMEREFLWFRNNHVNKVQGLLQKREEIWSLNIIAGRKTMLSWRSSLITFMGSKIISYKSSVAVIKIQPLAFYCVAEFLLCKCYRLYELFHWVLGWENIDILPWKFYRYFRGKYFILIYFLKHNYLFSIKRITFHSF